jgi:hypothetical protein
MLLLASMALLVVTFAVLALAFGIQASSIFLLDDQFVDVSKCEIVRQDSWSCSSCTGNGRMWFSGCLVKLNSTDSNLFCAIQGCPAGEFVNCAAKNGVVVLFDVSMSLAQFRQSQMKHRNAVLTVCIVFAAISGTLAFGTLSLVCLLLNKRRITRQLEIRRERQRREQRRRVVMVLLSARLKQQPDACMLARVDMFVLRQLIEYI